MVATTPGLDFLSQPGWMPVRAFSRRGQIWLDWAWCADADFRTPFFADGIQHTMRLPLNQAARPKTALNALNGIDSESYAKTVRVLIHHVTRCGSTAISRAYAHLENVAVVSEAGVIDEYLHWARHAALDEAHTAAQLRQLSAMLLRRGPASCRFGVLKLDSWQLLDAATWARAFPDALSVVVVREPLEVAVSHLRQPGWSSVPGAIPTLHPDMSLEAQCEWGREGYIARTLAVYFAAAERLIIAGATAFDYRDLHTAVLDRIPRSANLALDEADYEALRSALTVHSKSPTQSFVNDSVNKLTDVSPMLRQEIDTHVTPIWHRICQLIVR